LVWSKISLQLNLPITIIIGHLHGINPDENIMASRHKVKLNPLDGMFFKRKLILGRFPIGDFMSDQPTFAPLVDTKEAAEITGLSYSILRGMRLKGEGPTVVRAGRKFLYDLETLIEWRKSNWAPKS
jgi:hypothetical protein